jgi:hypothetical protein
MIVPHSAIAGNLELIDRMLQHVASQDWKHAIRSRKRVLVVVVLAPLPYIQSDNHSFKRHHHMFEQAYCLWIIHSELGHQTAYEQERHR